MGQHGSSLPAHNAPMMKPFGQGRRVLVVDGNEDAARTLATIMELVGFSAFPVFDGESAIEVVTRELPYMVFLAIKLPKVDGIEVCRRLRRLPGGDKSLVFALTGYDREPMTGEIDRAGFDRLIVKPADLSTLVQAITSAGDARNIERQFGTNPAED